MTKLARITLVLGICTYLAGCDTKMITNNVNNVNNEITIICDINSNVDYTEKINELFKNEKYNPDILIDAAELIFSLSHINDIDKFFICKNILDLNYNLSVEKVSNFITQYMKLSIENKDCSLLSFLYISEVISKLDNKNDLFENYAKYKINLVQQLQSEDKLEDYIKASITRSSDICYPRIDVTQYDKSVLAQYYFVDGNISMAYECANGIDDLQDLYQQCKTLLLYNGYWIMDAEEGEEDKPYDMYIDGMCFGYYDDNHFEEEGSELIAADNNTLIYNDYLGKIIFSLSSDGRLILTYDSGYSQIYLQGTEEDIINRYNSYIKNNPGPQFINKVDPYIGMLASEVVDCTWGLPRKINKLITTNGTYEQWVYNNKYLYIENDSVSSIQIME